MNVLIHNPIADLHGYDFLLFYLIVIVAVIVLCRRAVSMLDTSDAANIPTVPLHPDPYQIALMRGGTNEVLRVAIFKLSKLAYIVPNEKKPLDAARLKTNLYDDQINSPEFSPIDRAVLRYFKSAKTASSIFNTATAAEVNGHCLEWSQSYKDEGFMYPQAIRAHAGKIAWYGDGVILFLGWYKFIVAMNTGHHNVGFLCVLGIAGAVANSLICRTRRLTARGQAYVERLQRAFPSYNRAAQPVTDNGTMFNDMMILYVATNGFGSLSGTPDARYQTMFAQAASGGSCGFTSSGSSCGSSSSGSSGGSSCGGGGGGGGCGGGGCGG